MGTLDKHYTSDLFTLMAISLYLSQTQLLVSKIQRIIQEVCDINKYIGKGKTQQSNNLFRQEDLPHKRNPSPHNDE